MLKGSSLESKLNSVIHSIGCFIYVRVSMKLNYFAEGMEKLISKETKDIARQRGIEFPQSIIIRINPHEYENDFAVRTHAGTIN